MSSAAVAFRSHVIALPTGSRLDWRRMDDWAKTNCPYSEWVLIDNVMTIRADYWDDLTAECMGICEELAHAGWLAFANFDSEGSGIPDNYTRTAKP